MKIIFLFSALIVSLETWGQTSYVAPTRVLAEKGYQLGVSGDIFTSSKVLDQNGNSSAYPSGSGFTRLQSEVAGYYGLTSQFQVGGGVLLRQNISTINDERETSTGVQSTFVTLSYAFLPVDRLRYTIEGTYRYMPYTNSSSSLILGDEGSEYSGGLGVTYASRTNNFLTVRGGVRQPGTDLSSEIYWQLEGAMVWNQVALIAGVNGVSSMNNDPFDGSAQARPVMNTGATNLYQSTNREWIAPYAGINLAIGPSWRVELRGSQVLSGRSTDLGTVFGFSVIRRVEDSKQVRRTDAKFKEYDFEATVLKVSPKQGFVSIDKGLSDDIRKGMRVDFFEFDYVGGNILLARGIVLQAKSDTAIVKITQTFNPKRQVKQGVVVRGSYR